LSEEQQHVSILAMRFEQVPQVHTSPADTLLAAMGTESEPIKRMLAADERALIVGTTAGFGVCDACRC
jgi:hypothetical protein